MRRLTQLPMGAALVTKFMAVMHSQTSYSIGLKLCDNKTGISFARRARVDQAVGLCYRKRTLYFRRLNVGKIIPFLSPPQRLL